MWTARATASGLEMAQERVRLTRPEIEEEDLEDVTKRGLDPQKNLVLNELTEKTSANAVERVTDSLRARGRKTADVRNCVSRV